MKNKYIKKIILFSLSALLSFSLHADEGMWLPQLLNEMVYNDMKSKGLQLSAEQIYDINKSSLKDAIVHFGGGCTAEMISKNGLLLTNHHCGYGMIQSHSTVEKDYLTNGFWAKNNSEELPNNGLTATFIKRIDDVTDKILENVSSDNTELENQKIIAENIKLLSVESVKGTHFEAIIKPFFYGNKYYMFTTETFKDVRLVGAPPSDIGKFGGDTDNWMWPRHTGDFSIFRIYANKNNEPSDYSAENVPYKPNHHLPISLKGVEEGDFTMVFGFPGRTQEYLTSYAVDYLINKSNPAKINLREMRLNSMDRYMKQNKQVWLQYAAKYARISNYHKKWIGEAKGLQRVKAIESKQIMENNFSTWASANNYVNYKSLLPSFQKIYSESNDLSLSIDYLYEAVLGVEILSFTNKFSALFELAKSSNFDEVKFNEQVKKLKNQTERHWKDYYLPIDKEICPQLLTSFKNDMPQHLIPTSFKNNITDVNAFSENIFEKSIFSDKKKTIDFLNKANQKSVLKLEKDPAFKFIYEFVTDYKKNIYPKYAELSAEIELLNKSYLKGLMEMQSDKKFYPDANSTLRLSYGKVGGYKPFDGAEYGYYTTIGGLIDKGNMDVYDYVVPKKMIELFNKRDFGKYADKNGDLRLCFIATNHTTGGNSGSPVLNAKGELIGLNFDRTWQSTMSDVMYDASICRNIAVDIRYVLFVIDKFAGASYLVDEMDLVLE